MLWSCWILTQCSATLQRFGLSSEAQHLKNSINIPLQLTEDSVTRLWSRADLGSLILFFSLQPDLNDERVFWYKVCAEVTGCWWECVWWWSADHTGQSEARDPKKAVREAYFLFGVAFAHTQLYKSAMFYTNAERPPALGDVWRDGWYRSSVLLQ